MHRFFVQIVAKKVPTITRGAIFLVVLVTAACDSWPPHERTLRNHFSKNEHAITMLKDAFVASPFSAMSYSSTRGEIMASNDENVPQRPVNGADAVAFRTLLVDANVLSVYRIGSLILVQPYFESAFPDAGVSVRYVFGDELTASDCNSIQDRTGVDSCQMKLKENWAILYIW